MIKKEEVEAIVEIVEDVVCDVTGKSTLEDADNDDYVYHCTLTMMKLKKSDMITENFDEAVEYQSTEMCKEVYDKVINILNNDMGGKCPSLTETIQERRSHLN